MTFSGSKARRQGGGSSTRTGIVEPEAEWQPIPLELPLDDPYRRPPVPAGGEHNTDPDGDGGRRVIIIDLA
jgi:hypothetical protein